jgi:hypothetical protein
MGAVGRKRGMLSDMRYLSVAGTMAYIVCLSRFSGDIISPVGQVGEWRLREGKCQARRSDRSREVLLLAHRVGDLGETSARHPSPLLVLQRDPVYGPIGNI